MLLTTGHCYVRQLRHALWPTKVRDTSHRAMHEWARRIHLTGGPQLGKLFREWVRTHNGTHNAEEASPF